MSSARGAGLVAAVVLALLFGVTLFLSLGPDQIVVPTNGVTAGGQHDNPAGLGSIAELQARTLQQAWPGEAPATKSGQMTEKAPGQPSLALGAPAPSGAQLTDQWL